MNPLNDFLFLKVMGEKGDEVQLLGFLNAVLGKTGNDKLAFIEIIENKSFYAGTIGDKTCILDVRAVLHDGTRVNIEVQIRNQNNIDKRSLFYWSREFSISLDAGQDYYELPKVIAVNVLDFEFIPGGNFHKIFRLREDNDNSLILTDTLEIHFLDMEQWRRLPNKNMENDSLHRWLAWLDVRSPPELVTEVKKMDSAIQKADDRMVYVTGDKEAIRAYEMRMMALSDITSSNNYARREGLMEGLKEGREENLKEIVLKMKNLNVPVNKITEYTGLSDEAIGKIVSI